MVMGSGSTGQNWQSILGFSERIKYSNVPVLTIRIGNWRKVSLFSGDLVAKILYEERKFVWEVYLFLLHYNFIYLF